MRHRREPETEQAVDIAYREAFHRRKEFGARRKIERATLTPDQLRQKRNQEILERIIAARRGHEQAAA